MQVDARDLFNPKPLMMAMEALTRLPEGESLAVLANDGKAVDSLVRLAEDEGYKLTLEDEGDYSVVEITPTHPFEGANAEAAAKLMELPGGQRPVIILSSDYIGVDDRVLGRAILREMLFDMATQEVGPQAIVFLNAAVKLTCEDETCIEYLKMYDETTEIYSEIMSLDRYGLEDELKVGEVIEPYNLAHMLMSRTNIVTL